MIGTSVFTATAVLSIALGVVIAVVYPILMGYVRGVFTATAGMPPWFKKYSALLVFSLLTGLIVLAIYEQTNPGQEVSFLGGLLLGFGYESSLEKLVVKP